MASAKQFKLGADAARIQRQLKAAGDKIVTREFNKGFNRSARHLTDNVKKSAPKYLPDRYAAELVPSLKVAVRKRGGKNPSVRLVTKAKTRRGKPRELGTLNAGQLRHPTWGTSPWVGQKVKAGFHDQPMKAGAPAVRKELERAIKDIEKTL
jgi:hypothetical protein